VKLKNIIVMKTEMNRELIDNYKSRLLEVLKVTGTLTDTDLEYCFRENKSKEENCSHPDSSIVADEDGLYCCKCQQNIKAI